MTKWFRTFLSFLRLYSPKNMVELKTKQRSHRHDSIFQQLFLMYPSYEKQIKCSKSTNHVIKKLLLFQVINKDNGKTSVDAVLIFLSLILGMLHTLIECFFDDFTHMINCDVKLWHELER